MRRCSRGLLFDNLGLKLVALLLALVVYLHVYTDRPATMLVSFPIEVDRPRRTRSTSWDRARRPCTAELRGTGKQLIRLRLTEPSVRMSLAGAHVGVHRRRVVVEDLPVRDPEPLEVQRMIEPADVEFDIERVVAKSVRVVAQFAGGPAGGTSPQWIAQPASVLVRGPRSVLADLDSLLLEPVKVRGTRDSMRVTARITAPPKGCTIDPETVSLRVVPLTPCHDPLRTADPSPTPKKVARPRLETWDAQRDARWRWSRGGVAPILAGWAGMRHVSRPRRSREIASHVPPGTHCERCRNRKRANARAPSESRGSERRATRPSLFAAGTPAPAIRFSVTGAH